MKYNEKYSIILTIFSISLILIILWGGVRFYKSYIFENQCTAYLKRAADANTVEIAAKELDIAITYLEEHNLTKGVVSIMFHKPKNDIGFWYNNLVASRNELRSVKPDTNQLEKTNILMKLRETLLDEDGEVTCPEGITIYPNNVLYFIWAIVPVIILIIIGALVEKIF